MTTEGRGAAPADETGVLDPGQQEIPVPDERDVTVSKEGVILLSALLAGGFMVLTGWALEGPLWDFETLPFLLLVAVGAVMHEGLHALGWMVAGRIPVRSFRFGVMWRYGTLYAHCDRPMSMRAYRLGGALPGILTGVAPWAAGLALDHTSLALAGALLTAGAAGDGAVLWASRAVAGGTLVEDHPTKVGLRLCTVEGHGRASGSDA